MLKFCSSSLYDLPTPAIRKDPLQNFTPCNGPFVIWKQSYPRKFSRVLSNRRHEKKPGCNLSPESYNMK